MKIHPTAIIECSALPWDIEVGAYCVLVGEIEFGARVKISPHVVIGTDGEHRTALPIGSVRIGDDVVIREFSIVHRGTGDRETSIGARSLIMHNGHVAHDVEIGPDVTLSPNVTLGGHTRVHRGATIGIGAMTHQHTTIGAYSMIGMGSVVTKDVPPFLTVAGNPAKYLRANLHGMERANPDAKAILDYQEIFLADRRGGRKILDTR